MFAQSIGSVSPISASILLSIWSERKWLLSHHKCLCSLLCFYACLSPAWLLLLFSPYILTSILKYVLCPFLPWILSNSRKLKDISWISTAVQIRSISTKLNLIKFSLFTLRNVDRGKTLASQLLTASYERLVHQLAITCYVTCAAAVLGCHRHTWTGFISQSSEDSKRTYLYIMKLLGRKQHWRCTVLYVTPSW